MKDNDDSQPTTPLATAGSAASPDQLLAKAENLLTQITQLTESAKAAATGTSTSKQQADVALADIKTKVADIAAIATQAIAARTQITDAQAVIAAKSDHIQQAQIHADKVRGELDTTNTSATKQATEAEGLRTRAQTAAEEAAVQLAAVRVVKGTVDTEAAAITAARDTALKSAVVTKGLADKAASVEDSIAAYEKRLAELDTQCSTQLQEITRLLSGATNVGLAHAWDIRRQSFLNPGKRWQMVFVVTVCVIVVLTGGAVWQHLKTDAILSYDDLYRLWLTRLPVVGALIWLAMHASRESALAKRLEEDYGFKSATASSFQGFQERMSEIGTSAAPGSPLAKLCVDALSNMASPPGRIYDKHRLTVSPGDNFTEAAKAAEEVIKGK